MSIKKEFFDYLRHFGATVPLRDFLVVSEYPDAVALRHDVDYDLDLALELAYWEQKAGCRSTFFLLHTAAYWTEPSFVEKCLQLQDFGHEVGLHVNLLAEWFKGVTSDPAARLKELLSPLEAAGVEITGTAAHGDRLCYKEHFINYWCFEELRPSDPVTHESNRNAEGLLEEDSSFQIHYPKSHKLHRSSDGTTDATDLWSVSMSDHGLRYDASHLPMDRYFTDSGGGWTRTADPMTEDLTHGRFQVLVHPIYWRGPKRQFFFLSTARSGSTWLASLLDKSTPLTTRHEFTLNHRYRDGALVEEKRTAHGFADLMVDSEELLRLFSDARRWIDQRPGDYGEANVYLPHVLHELKEIFPQATLVHVHRDPKDVVRSIIHREWYATAEDNAHPSFDFEHWASLDQFGKACSYVGRTNETLTAACGHRLRFEDMVSDQQYISETLQRLEIPFFPRLAEPIFGDVLNAGTATDFPEYHRWTATRKILFHYFCGGAIESLGYRDSYREDRVCRLPHWLMKGVVFVQTAKTRREDRVRRRMKEVIATVDFGSLAEDRLFLKGCRVAGGADGVRILPQGSAAGHRHVLLGGRQWHRLGRGNGWPLEEGCYYRGRLDVGIATGDAAYLMCLLYREDGSLLDRKRLGQIRADNPCFRFSFVPRDLAERFNLALYLPATAAPKYIDLKSLQIEKLPLSRTTVSRP